MLFISRKHFRPEKEFDMNSHVNASNGNGANGAHKKPLIVAWTISKFREAVRNGGYAGVQLVYLCHSSQCCFPRCPMRIMDPDRPFTENDEICLWKVWRKDEEPRIIPCCAWHTWNDILRGSVGNNDISIEKVAFREGEMIIVFAKAMGFYLVKAREPIPVVGGGVVVA